MRQLAGGSENLLITIEISLSKPHVPRTLVRGELVEPYGPGILYENVETNAIATYAFATCF